jgi:uncharacterized protein
VVSRLDNWEAFSYDDDTMIRARLAEYPIKTLLELAQEHDVDVSPDMTKQTLIDLIADEIEDAILERELDDNHPIKIERKKYDLFGAGALPVSMDVDDESALPERYNETRVIVMLRDPAWAFAYWDLSDGSSEPVSEEEQYEELIIRVVEVTPTDTVNGSAREVSSFDIPVQLGDSSRYINLPQQETWYRIDLVARIDESEMILASSNVVAVPAGNFAPMGNGDIAERTDRILAMSGLQKLDVPTYGSNIPQRIISFVGG